MRKVLFLAFLFFNVSLYAEYKYQLSICAIFQNEAPYLKEWIEYHKLIGVEHFYLFNHCSSDHFQEVLQPYIDSGTVDLKHEWTVTDGIKTFHPIQCRLYTECVRQARGQSKWIAFLDLDEFLLPIQKQLLPNLLEPYAKFGGLEVNWLVFGTSSLKKIPENKLLIESLTQCSEITFWANRYVKSIVRPEHTSHFENAHHPVYLKGFFGVNTDMLPFSGVFSDYVRINKLRINHYWTRDEEYFYNKKIARQEKWGGTPNPASILKKMNSQKDELILRYVPDLRKAVYPLN